MTRTGLSVGLAIEDIGVLGDATHEMTEDDLLHDNIDLIEFCAHVLTSGA